MAGPGAGQDLLVRWVLGLITAFAVGAGVSLLFRLFLGQHLWNSATGLLVGMGSAFVLGRLVSLPWARRKA